MRRILTLCAVLGGAVVAADPETIRWEQDLATARAEATRGGRPILLYFTFDT